MEKPGHVILLHRKGWLTITVVLFCLFIAYWIIKNKHLKMASGTTSSINGVLYQSATGTPVAGAIVMVAEGSYDHPDMAAQSDEQGQFSLPDLQVPGTYTLLINYSNQSKRVTVNLTGGDILKIPL